MEYTSARTAAQLGGAALIGSLFLPWFGIDLGKALGDIAVGISASETGWEIMKQADIALAMLGGIAVVQFQVGSAALMGRLFALAGLLAAAFIVVRIVDPPFAFLSAVGLEINPRPGAFVGAASSLLIAYGGWMEIQRDTARKPMNAYDPVSAAGVGGPRSAHGQHITPAPVAGGMPVTNAEELFGVAPAAAVPTGEALAAARPAVPPDPFAVQRHPGG